MLKYLVTSYGCFHFALGEKGAADRNADHELLVAYLCEEPRISSINVIFVEHAELERVGRQAKKTFRVN